MKNIILIVTFYFSLSFSALAEYTMIIPQKPGGGTSQWAQIIAQYLEPHLGESIRLQHIPGARDIPGFNKFHNELRFDEKTIMVSHGGNGVSYLTEQVDYNYRDYTPIGGMNLTIVVGEKDLSDHIYFAGGSGQIPDVMALTLYQCGNLDSFDAYEKCFKEKITFVKGMSGSERRLAFNNGELNVTRENPASYKKHVAKNKDASVLFTHGIADVSIMAVVDDPNYPNLSFEKVFTAKWGERPKGEFYEAYLLIKNYRDTLQKALWVNKDNPNAEKIKTALTNMLQDEKAVSAITKKVGSYDWFIGTELLSVVDYLENNKKDNTLNYLKRWQSEVLGYKVAE